MEAVMAPQTERSIADDDAELLLLDQLLEETESVNNNKTKETAVPRLKEDSTFADAFSYDLPPEKPTDAAADVQGEELDSSDDEGVRNFLERKYNEYGCDINQRLKSQRKAEHEVEVERKVQQELTTVAAAAVCTIKNPHKPVQRVSQVSSSFQRPAAPQVSHPVATSSTATTFTDPVFRLRIINPLVSSALLVERMSGRKSVGLAELAFHTQRGDLSKDWVVAGVLVHKSPVRTSKKGQQYSIWRISDLRGEIKMASVFLFKSAHKELWKTAQGMCVAILNPNVFEKRAESGDVACLSIDTAQKVMVLGQSQDMATCKAHKKNGEPCSAVVNRNECDYCVYHMKQEYSKMSQRSDLQSATAGRGLHELRNKVLGKSEVFYGGQSFTAIPARKSSKLAAKDSERMSTLSEYAVSPFTGNVNHISQPKVAAKLVPYASREGPISKVAGNVDASIKQRHKDLERLRILQADADAKAQRGAHDSSIGPEATALATSPSASTSAAALATSPSASTSAAAPESFAAPTKFQNRGFSGMAASVPKLSRDNFCIEVNVGQRQAQLAKQRAAQVLKKSPLPKANPNSVRGSQEGKRRAIDDLHEKYTAVKRQKLEADQQEQERKSRIQRIIDASSSHRNLIDMREQQEQDQYFSKLEKKEALEEKMLNTYKVPCKAVICQQCKYTAFAAAERCKTERHALKVVDAEKRFFQCKDCGSRTVTVFKLPKISCKNCKSSRWERCAMIRDRKVGNDSAAGLSVRGDEETFLGSSKSQASLNLLVPDEE